MIVKELIEVSLENQEEFYDPNLYEDSLNFIEYINTKYFKNKIDIIYYINIMKNILILLSCSHFTVLSIIIYIFWNRDKYIQEIIDKFILLLKEELKIFHQKNKSRMKLRIHLMTLKTTYLLYNL